MDDRKRCEDVIDGMLNKRIEDFKHALDEDWEYFDDGYEYEDFIEWINSYALAYDDDPHYRAKRLELSWGGPSDYFLFFEDGTIEYHYLDWYDGAKRTLYDDKYKIMKEVYDIINIE